MTIVAPPNKNRPVAPFLTAFALWAAGAGCSASRGATRATETGPASPRAASRGPEIEDDPISQLAYPEGEAKSRGLEGETLLRIAVDESGRVHSVTIVKSMGGGAAGAALDELARRHAYKLRFRPARDKSGKPVAFVLEPWHVTWMLDP